MTRTMTVLVIGLSALTVAAVPTTASASSVTFFSNLTGGSPAYDVNQANLVGDDFSNSCANGTDCWIGQGVSFVASATGNLSDIQLALSYPFDAPSSDVLVRLQSDSGGPVAVLESFNVAPAALGLLGNNNPLITLTSISMPLLTVGNTYWLTVNSGSRTDVLGWNLNASLDTSSTATSLDGGATWFTPSNETPGAFRVNGITATPVPEPSTLLLVGGGVLTALRRRRAR